MSCATGVAVLAAGVGSRLGLSEAPKWLAPLAGGKRIADLHLSALQTGSTECNPFIVVTGFEAEQIGEFLGERVEGLSASAQLIHNPRFQAANNWYSLLLALRSEKVAQSDRNLIVINSDVVAAPDCLRSLVEEAASADTSTMVIDPRSKMHDEAMKVTVDRTGAIEHLGKSDLPASPYGEYIGVCCFTARDRKILADTLAAFEGDCSRWNAWYEQGIVDAIARGMRVVPIMVDSPWIEVDDPEDLLQASLLAGQW